MCWGEDVPVINDQISSRISSVMSSSEGNQFYLLLFYAERHSEVGEAGVPHAFLGPYQASHSSSPSYPDRVRSDSQTVWPGRLVSTSDLLHVQGSL